MTNYPNSRKANIVVQDLENEVLIYDLSINKAFCLNQTSALVYQMADGTRTIGEIGEAMSVKLKTKVSEDLVWLALDGLRKDKLLENADEVPDSFGGLSRREVVKRVGLASMVMLPLIASVVAPSAAAAQSNLLGFFAVCTAPGQCSSGNCQFAMFGTGDGMQHCCVASSTGGAHPGQIIAAAFDLCFPNCNTGAPAFCCSGQAQTAPGGTCGINQQFRCSCV